MKVTSSGLNPNSLELNKAENKKNDLKDLGKNSALNQNKEDSAKINVSQNARDINRIKEVAMAAPDVDQQKVAKFKELINSGKYEVNAQAIADRMVDQELALGKLEN